MDKKASGRGWQRYRLLFAMLGLLGVAPCSDAGLDWWQTGREWLGMGAENETAEGLASEQIVAGLKEALRVAADTVSAQLGQVDGFNADPKIHIALPEHLQQVRTALAAVGMSGLLDDLELRLNRAAEAAAPKARGVFWQAIEQMTMEDARSIYQGADDSATRYFRKTMSQPLATMMRPVIEAGMADAGVVRAYEQVMGEYRNLPFVPDVKGNLTEYVVAQGLEGIFYYLGQEEAAIRNNPAKRTTELLKQVFGTASD